MRITRRRIGQGAAALITAGALLAAGTSMLAAAPGGHGDGHGQGDEGNGKHASAVAAAVTPHAPPSNGDSDDQKHGRAAQVTVVVTPHATAAARDDQDDQGHGPKRGDDDTRPGLGCGDKNHVHTGAPGAPAGFNPCDKDDRTPVSGTATATGTPATATPTKTGTPATSTPTSTATVASSATATATASNSPTATTTNTGAATPTATATDSSAGSHVLGATISRDDEAQLGYDPDGPASGSGAPANNGGGWFAALLRWLRLG